MPTIFITGATSGIGKASAELFAEHGYNLILNGRREERLQSVKQEIEGAHDVKVHLLPFDVQEQVAVEAAIKSLPTDWQDIDLLLNNAGLARGAVPIQDGSLQDWEEMIDTNVKGLLYVSKAVMPLMIERKRGHIINISSIAGKETYANGNVYCATKHAVESLTRAMRVDLLPHNIKVSSVSPGAVETEFSVVRYHGSQEKADQVYQGYDPLVAQDIAEAIYFCASRPPHVNVNDILIMPTVQASSAYWNK